jgi:hypothetical protein
VFFPNSFTSCGGIVDGIGGVHTGPGRNPNPAKARFTPQQEVKYLAARPSTGFDPVLTRKYCLLPILEKTKSQQNQTKSPAVVRLSQRNRDPFGSALASA